MRLCREERRSGTHALRVLPSIDGTKEVPLVRIMYSNLPKLRCGFVDAPDDPSLFVDPDLRTREATNFPPNMGCRPPKHHEDLKLPKPPDLRSQFISKPVLHPGEKVREAFERGRGDSHPVANQNITRNEVNWDSVTRCWRRGRVAKGR